MEPRTDPAAVDFWADYWEPGTAGSRVVPRRPASAPGVAVQRVRYGPAPQHMCELRLPSSESASRLSRAGRVPIAVFVHGGFWKCEWAHDLAHAMADDLAGFGWASWNLEYRRVGYKANGYEGDEGAGWPGTLQDVATALDKLADVAAARNSDKRAAFGLDLERVVVIGHSAGGHLALWLAQAYRQTEVGLLACAGRTGQRCRIIPAAVVGQAPVADLHKA